MAKSKMAQKLDKEVTMTMPVSFWITVQQAVAAYDMKRVDPRLIDDYQRERVDILERLEILLDKEFPIL